MPDSERGWEGDPEAEEGRSIVENETIQREWGRRLEERLSNLSDDDLQWLAGTGRYGQ